MELSKTKFYDDYHNLDGAKRSPVTSYLKRVSKDNLAPRFGPFSNVTQNESAMNTSSFMNTSFPRAVKKTIEGNIQFDLSGFQIHDRIAPAII